MHTYRRPPDPPLVRASVGSLGFTHTMGVGSLRPKSLQPTRPGWTRSEADIPLLLVYRADIGIGYPKSTRDLGLTPRIVVGFDAHH